MTSRRNLRALAAALALCAPLAGRCGEGVEKDVIWLGQTADQSGSRAGNLREFNGGALTYFESVNQSGGVHGRRIELVSVDDAYSPERSVANVRELLDKGRAFVVFSPVGTENFMALEQKVTTPGRVPLFAPSSGAEVLRAPHKRYVFPVRSSNHAEMEKIVEHLTTIGVRKISIFHDDDSFGRDNLLGVERAMAKRGLKIHSAATVDREGKRIAEAVGLLGPTRPEAIVVGSAGSTALRFAREVLKQDYQLPLYLNSGANMASLVKELGDGSRGIAVMQTMPAVNDANYAVTREFKKAAASRPGTPLTPKALEGFVSAKILVEGLRRAGKGLTREKLVTALEELQNFDVGGMQVYYSATEHRGLTYADLAVISQAGRTLR
jgi:ABC-type branched-subunit amino acid transport system substrate-binding protein